MSKTETIIKKLMEKLHGYEIYISGNPELIKNMNITPFGIETKIIDIYDNKNQKIIESLHTLDGLAYGNHSIAMPKWVMLDCGLIPGAFIGLGKKYYKLSDEIKEKISIEHTKEFSSDDFIPISEFCAIPQYGSKNHFVAHTLACIDNGKNLGLWTKILGLEIYGANKIIGIAQYNNNSLKTHTKISPLKILATEIFHEDKNTFVYEAYYNSKKAKAMIKGAYKYDNIENLLKKGKAFLFDYQNDDKSLIKEKYILPPGQIMYNGKIYIPIKYSD